MTPAASLEELLKYCTVQLLPEPDGRSWGTGFFVSPGYILTCEHVVRGWDPMDINVRWGEDKAFTTAELVQSFPQHDLALLSFERQVPHPCVWLDADRQQLDDLALFGYPDKDYPDGCPVTATDEGVTGGKRPEIKFKEGQIRPGISGASLLNCRTGKVCGMVKVTRQAGSDLGGGAVPTKTILELLPTAVVEAHDQFHQQDSRWRDLLPQASPQQGITGIPFNLEDRGSQTFVGRDETLKQLHQQLQENQTLSITALQGMGGIGKTELAVQYAQQYKRHYPSGVCWLQAREQDVSTQLVNFAASCLDLPPIEADLPEQVQHVWSHWPVLSGDERVLLVYDDVADYKNVETALPNDSRFQVLFTTRQQSVAAGVKDFALDVLPETEALELMRQIVDDSRVDDELDTAKAICKWLGYLPLGIELVAYYLKQDPDCDLVTLQARLAQQKLAAQAMQKKQAGTTAKLGVYEAFELSWQVLDEDAQQLACWLSLFALAPIPWEMAAVIGGEDGQEELETARNELRKRSLVQRLAKGQYQLHQLLREFFLAKLGEWEDGEALKQGYCKLIVGIARQVPQSPTQQNIMELTPLLPHIEEAATTWQTSLSDEDNELSWPFVALARFYEGQGACGQTEPWYVACLAATRDRFGDEHPSVATSYNNLAGLYESQGRYEAAEPLYQQALQIGERVLRSEEHT